MTDEVKQSIQQCLNDGESIRQVAKIEGLSEGTIRYWIKKGKINKCSHII